MFPEIQRCNGYTNETNCPFNPTQVHCEQKNKTCLKIRNDLQLTITKD
jgi:hypothetical protein